MTAHILNCRQVHWNMLLSRFDFVITYRLGKQQGLFDALSTQSYLAPKEGEAAYEQWRTTLLKAELLGLYVAIMSTPIDSSFLNQIYVASYLDLLIVDIKCCSDNNHEKLKFVDDLLYFEEHLYIPEGPPCFWVLQACHDLLAIGHFGFNKILELISWDFWPPQKWKAVKEFVLSCNTCSRLKNPQHCPYGLLQPLPIPRQSWSFISMDFITDLPSSKNFDAIFIIVDRLTKMAHFVPCTKTITREETARFLVDNVYWYHGLPDDIISDQGPQFISKFWRYFFEILKVDIKLSLAFHH